MSLQNTSGQGSIVPAQCSTCGAPAEAKPANAGRSYVYALGRIEARFPTPGIEREFRQVAGRSPTEGLTDHQLLQAVLAERQNRYLARQLCWVFTIERLDTYALAPRDSADLDLLIDALRRAPDPADVDVVIGILGPLAPPDMCNGLIVPIVAFDQIYSFDRETLIRALPRPDSMDEDRFTAAAGDLFDRIIQVADNSGATDEHRALNYVAVRYPAVYARTADAFARNASLTAVDVRASRLSGVRKVVDVIFSYADRQTDVTEKYFVRVDVTEEFPFLVTKLSPYYER